MQRGLGAREEFSPTEGMCTLVPGGFIALGRQGVGWGLGNGAVVQAEGTGLVQGEDAGVLGLREGREGLAVRCGWTGG